MAIMIKNFQMQETCYECPFCDYEFGNCFADVEQRYTEGYGNISPNKPTSDYLKINYLLTIKRYGHGPGKPEWCPLEEILDNETLD